MADTMKTTREFRCRLNYTDKDYKTITIPNPKNNLSASISATISDFAKFTVGDKAGAGFSDVSNGEVIEKAIYTLDIGVNAS